MSVRGSAETVSLVDLLSLIHGSGHAGTLNLRTGERKTKLHFFKGKIYLPTGGSSGAYRIGALLVRAGKLTGRELLRALEQQKREGHRERLGDLLVREGVVTREALDAVIRTQFEEEICDLLFELDAEYEFRKGVLPAGFTDAQGNILALGFDIRSILMEASRRQDEWRKIRAVLPSGRAILAVARVSSDSWQVEGAGGQAVTRKFKRAKLGEESAEVLARWRDVHALFEQDPFDGARTVDEVVAASGVTAFTAMGVIADLVREGIVRPLSRQEVEAEVLAHLKAGRTKLAYKLFEWANESDRLRETASRLDSVLLKPEYLEGASFASRTSSVRALQILSRLLRRGAPFRFLCREAESQVEVFYTPRALRLHLEGPRRTHSTTRYLRKRRALSSVSLDRARETARLERRNLDRVLLEDGFVERTEWVKAVKDKAVSGMFSIFGWTEPYLEVEGGVIPPPPPEEVTGLVCEIPLSDELRESLRRDLLRWKVLLKEVPTPDVVLITTGRAPASGPRRATDLFNGRRTVGDLIQLARVAPLELVRFIYDAITAGRVRPLSDREHYERVEASLAKQRLDEAIVYSKSAIAWKITPQLYAERLKDLRRRLQDQPNTESRPVLQGDVATFSLAEVLQLLHQGRRTGTLRVHSGDREQAVYLDGGDLYVLKVEQSEADQEVWDLLLGDESRSSIDLGDLLKRRGLFDQSDLSQTELASLKDELFDAFLWEGATYEFTQNLLPSELREESDRATKVKLNTPMLLMEAMGRLAEWDELRTVLKSSRAIFRWSSQEAQLEAVRQGLCATAYLYDGKHSLADVARISGQNRFKLYREARERVERGELVFQSLKPRGAKGRRSPSPLASGRLPRVHRPPGRIPAARPAHGGPKRPARADVFLSDELDLPPELGDSMEV